MCNHYKQLEAHNINVSNDYIHNNSNPQNHMILHSHSLIDIKSATDQFIFVKDKSYLN
jgi:hypothetical protein